MEKITPQEALDRFETIWANVECGVSIIDAETREIVDINPVAVKMFEGNKEDIIGHRCHKFICPAEEHSCPIMDKNQVVDRSERKFVKANGEIIPIIKSVAKINDKGRVLLLESFIDISTLKEAEENLRLLSITEQANQAKSDFLSRMSHEMRTPLNAIIGMTKLAENTKDASKLEHCLETIGQSANHLLGLINDILDMSKIEAGKFELHIGNFSIQDVLSKTNNFFVEQLKEKNIKLKLQQHKNIAPGYIGDEMRLSQVVTNLISNAIKFTPENGEITISARETQHGADSSILRFEVSDTGIGMDEEQINKLFNAFEQADTSITRRFGGTGLGLSISKSIVEMMNGKMWAESTPGEGSTFFFEIELVHNTGALPDEAAGKITQVVTPDFAGKNALIAEDIEINREIIIALLETTKINIDTAENGRRAVEAFAAESHKYDIIIMDVHMPEMNGLEATQAIRAIGTDKAKNIPIIAMTADVFSEDIDKCLAAGMNDHLGKPINHVEVFAKLTKYLAK